MIESKRLPASETERFVRPPVAVPGELAEKLHAALSSGRWVCILAHIYDGKIFHERIASDFPTDDLSELTRMIMEDLKELYDRDKAKEAKNGPVPGEVRNQLEDPSRPALEVSGESSEVSR